MVMKRSIDKMLKNWNATDGKKADDNMTTRFLKMKTKGGPSALVYAYGLSFGMWPNIAGYLSLPDDAWNAYIEGLNKLTLFLWDISSSPMYKSWANDKKIKYVSPKQIDHGDVIGVPGYQLKKDDVVIH
jgi:hypothetical protein